MNTAYVLGYHEDSLCNRFNETIVENSEIWGKRFGNNGTEEKAKDLNSVKFEEEFHVNIISRKSIN